MRRARQARTPVRVVAVGAGNEQWPGQSPGGRASHPRRYDNSRRQATQGQRAAVAGRGKAQVVGGDGAARQGSARPPFEACFGGMLGEEVLSDVLIASLSGAREAGCPLRRN